MKTIFISIFHGHLARNILRTKVLDIVAGHPNVKVVIVVPDFKKNYYQKEFSRDNVVVEGVAPIRPSPLDKFFRSFYYYFVDTKTVRIIQGEQFLLTRQYIKYAVARTLTFLIGHLRSVRQLIRFLDWRLVREDKALLALLDRYKPDSVFITSITSDQDTMLLRCAKKRGIATLGMVRSWDNITVNKGNVRVQPDKFIVHTEFLKDDLARYADVNPRTIEVVGMSHFDYYTNGQRIPREEFLRSVGADPVKKYIYFMPIGLSDEREDKKIVEDLAQIINTRSELAGYQLLVTLHPNTAKSIDLRLANVVLVPPRGLISFTDGRLVDREITEEAMELMASMIYHSELVVNYQGTSSLDAAAFDKPVVNIAFDDKNKPYLKSVRRFYNFTHYQPILKSGGVRLAHNLSELENLMVRYIKNPALDQAGRQRLVTEQCYKLDGKASERTAKAVLRSANIG